MLSGTNTAVGRIDLLFTGLRLSGNKIWPPNLSTPPSINNFVDSPLCIISQLQSVN
jgi:hypothetical protein